MSLLTYDNNEFYLNGEKLRIYSGAIHYFRVVPGYWEDRLLKLKECGFNTVETIIPWSLHEPHPGQFVFSGICDIEKYIETAKKLGLYVIIRPGAYICGEFNMGGLPYWLLKEPGMRVRCCHEGFLSRVEEYLSVLFDKLRPHLIENGGNIIAMQIENEYGSYGDDKEYLDRLLKIYEKNDIDCLLFTSDGPGYFMLSGGTVEGKLATVNFGNNPKDNFALLQKFRDNQPTMCMEYWNGWFDHWYEEHHKRQAGETAEVLREIIDGGRSVNLYMFHGGTNFGFTGGANYEEHVQPMVTSYDYNCPLSECGDLTDKYMEIHDVMEDVLGRELSLTVSNSEKRAFGKVTFTKKADLFDNLDKLSKAVSSPYPMTYEELDVGTGYVLYETEFEGPFEELDLEIDDLRDRASIYIDDEFKGIKEETGKRWDNVKFGLSFDEKADVKILTECLGRVNYGGHITDNKGILRGVKIANRYHFGWKMYPLCFDEIPCPVSDEKYKNLCGSNEINSDINWILDIDKACESDKNFSKRPGFYEAVLVADKACDTFIKLSGFTKGCVWINGFCIGRYYNPAGPQKTLYVPAPLLLEGENIITVFESDEMNEPVAEFLAKEELG